MRQELAGQELDIWQAVDTCDKHRVQQLVEEGADVKIREIRILITALTAACTSRVHVVAR